MKYLALLLLTACISRQQVEGQLWQHDRIPASICAQYPVLRQYGLFRVIKCVPGSPAERCGNGEPDYEEVLGYCTDRATHFIGADEVHVKEWLKALGRPR